MALCTPPFPRARSVLALAFAAIISSPILPARAADDGAYYAGKTLSLYIGSSVGGGYDAYGRLVARHIGKHIAGNPTVVPLNMDGTGSLRLANWLSEAAPRDGTAIGALNRGIAFVPLLGEAQFARFDAKAFGWIGSASNEGGVCIAHERSGITEFAQLYEEELIVGNTGPGADGSFMTNLVMGVLGAKLRPITGYAGGNEIYLAIEQGEVDGMCGIQWSALTSARPHWLEDGSVNVIIQLGLEPNPATRGAPMMMDLARSEEERRILRFVMLRTFFGRPFAVPPGVPDDIVAELRAAFDATMSDTQFLAEADTIRVDISPVAGARLDEVLEEAYGAPPELVARARELVN